MANLTASWNDEQVRGIDPACPVTSSRWMPCIARPIAASIFPLGVQNAMVLTRGTSAGGPRRAGARGHCTLCTIA
jgi:hypothetical protein